MIYSKKVSDAADLEMSGNVIRTVEKVVCFANPDAKIVYCSISVGVVRQHFFWNGKSEDEVVSLLKGIPLFDKEPRPEAVKKAFTDALRKLAGRRGVDSLGKSYPLQRIEAWRDGATLPHKDRPLLRKLVHAAHVFADDFSAVWQESVDLIGVEEVHTA